MSRYSIYQAQNRQIKESIKRLHDALELHQARQARHRRIALRVVCGACIAAFIFHYLKQRLKSHGERDRCVA